MHVSGPENTRRQPSSSSPLLARIGRLGALGRTAVLTASVTLLGFLLAPLAFRLSGWDGLAAVAVAAGLCWLGGELALLIGGLLVGPAAAMHAMVLGMLARMAVPLLGGAVLHLSSPLLSSAGMVFYLLAFYMLTLVVEAALTLGQVATAAETHTTG